MVKVEGISFEITEEEFEKFGRYLLSGKSELDYLTEYKREVVKPRTINRGSVDTKISPSFYGSCIAEKIEKSVINTRKTGCVEELIILYFAIGLSRREITLQFYRLGLPKYESFIKHFIAQHIWRLRKERSKLLLELKEHKDSVFQNLKAEIYDAERKTLQIYLRSINKLQDELSEVDPILEPAKYNRLANQIEMLQGRIKSAHGVDAIRAATIDAEKQILIMREKHKLEKGIPDTNGRVIEDKKEDSHFLEFTPDDSSNH